MRKLIVILLLGFSGITHAAPNVPISFSGEAYKPLDLQAYCSANYGSAYDVTLTGSHAFNWQCTNGSSSGAISIEYACDQQWGADYDAVLLGNHAYDWACTNWEEADTKVVPVVIIASDFFFNIDKVSEGVESVSEVLENTRTWYESKMDSGNTFEVVKPVVHLSSRSARYWNELSCISAQPSERPAECVNQSSPADRFKFFDAALNAVQPMFDNRASDTDLVVTIYVYTGDDAAPFWFGASANTVNGVAYNAQSPNIGSCDTGDEFCGVYATGHEAGHNFGLGHACDLVPQPANCGLSIMQNPSNDFSNAIILDAEQQLLEQSVFIK